MQDPGHYLVVRRQNAVLNVFFASSGERSVEVDIKSTAWLFVIAPKSIDTSSDLTTWQPSCIVSCVFDAAPKSVFTSQ